MFTKYEHKSMFTCTHFHDIYIYHSVDTNGAISLVNSLTGYFCIT